MARYLLAALESMSALLFLGFALVVGLLARAIMPGRQTLSWPATLLLGVAGSLTGAIVGAILTSANRELLFDTPSMTGSVIGALIALGIGEATRSRALV